MNMGKFPGKPSKIVNRKRIKASKCSPSQENDSIQAAENIYFGLAVFNEAFGNEQTTSEFLGFSPQEANAAVIYARKKQREVVSEYKANGLHISLKEHFEHELAQTKPVITINARIRRKASCESGDNVDPSKDLISKKLIPKSPPLSTRNLKHKAARKLLRKAKISTYVSADNSQLEKCNGAVRKFVLPSRSVHSSRVIKPNKRFIEAEEVLSDVSVSRSPNAIQLKKPRLSLTSSTPEPGKADNDLGQLDQSIIEEVRDGSERSNKTDSNSCGDTSKSLSPNDSSQENSLIVEGKRRWKPSYKVQLKLRELNVFGAGSNKFPLKRTHDSSTDSIRSARSASDKELGSTSADSSDSGKLPKPVNSEIKSDCSPDWSGSKLNSGGKVILRKARLKLDSHTTPGTEGPFSVNITGSGNSSLPGTVVCGVCGAVRFYRFVKQARKFGIFSCESCRKFISKIMKRQTFAKGGKMPVLECHKGTGTCSVPPIVRSQQWKPGRGTKLRCSYRARCPACWLRMCLRSFNMPDTLRESMARMLPPNMRKGLEKVPMKNTSYARLESTPSFIRTKPMDLDRVSRTPLQDSSGDKTGASTSSSDKIETEKSEKPDSSIGLRVSRKSSVSSVKVSSVKAGSVKASSVKASSVKVSSVKVSSVKVSSVKVSSVKVSSVKVSSVKVSSVKVSSVKRLRKREKQLNHEKSHSEKSKREKRLHSNKLLKKASKKLSKSKDRQDSLIERIRKKKISAKVRKKNGHKSDSSPGSDGTRRQKLDLKGPRVKHVCRSASIVLGQPQATFPLVKKVEKVPVNPVQGPSKNPSKSSCCTDCPTPSSSAVKDSERSSHSHNHGENSKSTKAATVPTVVATDADNSENSDSVRPQSSTDIASSSQDEEPPSIPSSYRRATKLSSSVQYSVAPTSTSTSTLPSQALVKALPVIGKRAEPQNPVSIDFWESYDPEEVCNTGFGLIGSEPFHVRAMCFLCGSAGREKLIHCAVCCEPYHKFCLEDGLHDMSFLSDSNIDEWRYNWVCQRCTVCHVCGRGLGQQMSCQRCHRTYHTDCLGTDRLSTRLHSPDRPWVCSTCLRCKSCGGADVALFVGNLPLCKSCFKLRQKGNYCPLCQRCYEDDDYDTKMMECGQCKCWVHAKCEGLSDEKYQVLSYLPESVEFVCRMCCVIPPAPWWIAVEEELKVGYLGVLKSLSKNRKACAMLKWSPKKQCLCKSVIVAKRLDFQGVSDRETETGDHSDVVREDMKIAVVPKNEVQKNDVQSSQQEISSTPELMQTEELNSGKCSPQAEVDCGPQNASQPDSSITSSLISSTVPDIDHKSLLIADGSLLDSSIPAPPNNNKSFPNVVNTGNVTQHLKEKYNLKDCSVRVENCGLKSSSKLPLTVKIEDNDTGFSPDSTLSEFNSKSPPKLQVVSMATPASDSGIGSTDDEFKPNFNGEEQEDTKGEDIEVTAFSPAMQSPQLLELAYRSNINAESSVSMEKCSNVFCDTTENVTSENTKECCCSDQHTLAKPSPTLLSIKKKVNANEYSSLLQFHQEMEHLISRAHCPELLETYHYTLKEVFPWFDPKFARVSSKWKDSRPGHEESPIKTLMRLEQQDTTHSEDASADHTSFSGINCKTEGLSAVSPKSITGQTTDYYYSGFTVQDLRTCILCKGVGDGLPVEEGRLLYCGQNEWVHANCALWSAEVFEEIDGSLQNVHSAVSRGRMIRCRVCGKKGASVGCCARNCNETFHFPCARRNDCAFMDDKTVFCSAHFSEAAGKPLHTDVEFDIRRPIYVELDRKKKKYAEPHQVKFMIGSLLIEKLGEFVPASDRGDIIIPADFQCTRLYWSSVEPWRIVRYYVKTTVRTAEPQHGLDLGKNLTVDHTQEQKLVKQKLDEVSRWHQQLISSCQKISNSRITDNVVKLKSKKSQPVEIQLASQKAKKEPKISAEEKIARQVMDQLLDSVCSRDAEDNCLSDPQTTADLLPPELKDAIFEDLPHDLLDGISMQDILPKLMSYEDLAPVDMKTDVPCFSTDVPKEEKDEIGEDGILESESEQVSSCEQIVKERKAEQTELGNQSDLWFNSDSREQGTVQTLVEDLLQNVYVKGSIQKATTRELKRSKSEIIPQPVSKKIGGSSRSHQRSCSLTWSCKLDGALASTAKRRKATRALPRSGGEPASSLVMVVDSSEKAHMLQELRLPDGVIVALSRTATPGVTSTSVAETVREIKYRLEEEPVPGEAAAVGRRKSVHQKEEGKENKCLLWHGRSQSRILQLDGAADSGSSSGSELGSPLREVEDDIDSFNPDTNVKNTASEKTAGDDEPVKCDRCHRTYRTQSSFERHLPICSSDFILSTSESDSENTRSSEEEGYKKLKSPSSHYQCSRRPSAELEDEHEKPKDMISVDKNNKSNILPSTSESQTTLTEQHPRTAQSAHRVYGRARGKALSRTLANRLRKETSSPATTVSPQPQHSPHSVPCQQQQAAPTVIMQQVPSPNMVPAFVEAFQQQTGQSLQYIATIDAHTNGYNKTPYIGAPPNSLVTSAFQLQAPPDNYVGLPNGGISVLPGVQLTPPQQAVIGTLIHQTPPTTIQCVAAEQVVLGSTPAIEMFTDQSGGMYLTSQPMYYGLETIVSNTVMSSSQFVSAALPGMMAASSSFSATTTQVFQASKLVEPIMDVPSSFVIMNPHASQIPPESGLARTDMITCTSSSLPINLPSAAMSQPSPSVAPQVQPTPIQNVYWRSPEYNNSDSFVPATTGVECIPVSSTQNVKSNTCTVTPTISYTPPTASVSPQTLPNHTQSYAHPLSIPFQPVTSLPVSTPLPTHPVQPQLRLAQPPQSTQNKNIVITIPATTCSTSTVSSSNTSTKIFKTNSRTDGPVRTVNRVFPLKINPSFSTEQTASKINKNKDQGSNNSITHAAERRVTVIPIPQKRNVNNGNNNNNNQHTNSLKLVFQKQAQDGCYKISKQNHHSKLIDSTKTGATPNQTLSIRTVKIKPRMVANSDKQKDENSSSLQIGNKIKIQNGTSSPTHFQNGKGPPFQEKNVLGSNTAPTITYEVHSQDGFSCTSSSITEVWQKVFEAVQEAREYHKMPRLPENPFGANSSGLQMLGFRHNALRYLVEQLPGVGRCIKYKPRYHKLRPPCPEDVDTLPLENASGCARCEPFKKRSEYDMFSWLASRHRQPPKFMVSAESESISNRRATSSNLPMAMRFRHLKETSKEAVGVYRSNIHGRGLFCLRDIEAGEMVIEYAGEVIRSMLTDKREKYYESKDIGCYMFRIDDQLVVDATMRGNAARFINHSCEPNCYSRVVDILGKKHILIFALRRIPQGEELTYDYKFPFEDVKIPCTCGSRRCRKYLN